MVTFGADEPNFSEPAKGLKEGVCQMLGRGVWLWRRRGWVQRGQR